MNTASLNSTTVQGRHGQFDNKFLSLISLEEAPGCNKVSIHLGSLIHATSHTDKQIWAVNMSCHHLLLIPNPEPSLNYWGGKPYCLVFFSGCKSNWYVDNDSMKCPSSKPHTVVPWWPFCTGKQKAHSKYTTLPTKYNTTHIKTP